MGWLTRSSVVALALLAPASLFAAVDPVVDTLWVDGMKFPDCDDIGLELLLETLAGVEDVTVEFETGRTTVTYDPAAVSRDQIVGEILNRGFGVPWVTEAFVVTGWEIARRDAPAVRLLVGSLDGVAQVDVDEATARTLIRYDPTRVERDALVTEVRNLGWDLQRVALRRDDGQ